MAVIWQYKGLDAVIVHHAKRTLTANFVEKCLFCRKMQYARENRRKPQCEIMFVQVIAPLQLL